jgi:hypothetical protein
MSRQIWTMRELLDARRVIGLAVRGDSGDVVAHAEAGVEWTEAWFIGD